jgi:hypothetical protein
MTITFACGHTQIREVSVDTPPLCGCGERRVARVVAPAPRFRGACLGPHAVQEALAGVAVSAAPGGPLSLKESQ